MKYELAKKLKDVGFPQSVIYYEECYINGVKCNYGNDQGLESERDGELVMIPTLSELIGACGEHFESLSRDGFGIWYCYYHLGFQEESLTDDYDTPEEAVANLWLALNEK